MISNFAITNITKPSFHSPSLGGGMGKSREWLRKLPHSEDGEALENIRWRREKLRQNLAKAYGKSLSNSHQILGTRKVRKRCAS